MLKKTILNTIPYPLNKLLLEDSIQLAIILSKELQDLTIKKLEILSNKFFNNKLRDNEVRFVLHTHILLQL